MAERPSPSWFFSLVSPLLLALLLSLFVSLFVSFLFLLLLPSVGFVVSFLLLLLLFFCLALEIRRDPRPRQQQVLPAGDSRILEFDPLAGKLSWVSAMTRADSPPPTCIRPPTIFPFIHNPTVQCRTCFHMRYSSLCCHLAFKYLFFFFFFFFPFSLSFFGVWCGCRAPMMQSHFNNNNNIIIISSSSSNTNDPLQLSLG